MLLFDIGANIGRYAIKNYNASTKIICVEASPRTAEKLRKNVECYENIIVENLAVSDSKQDTVSFYESQLDPLSTLDINWLLSDKSRFGNMNHNINMVEIKTISIDSLIQKYGIPDLLKIDVEGAEDRVINSLSMKGLNKSFTRKFLMFSLTYVKSIFSVTMFSLTQVSFTKTFN
jgi:FkbM family methyltransferase